jgi:phage-related protein
MKVRTYSSALNRDYVAKFIEDQRNDTKKKIMADLALIEKYGEKALEVLDHKKMRSSVNFWELRIRSSSIAVRIFYVVRDDVLWLIHAFVKKKQKTPNKHINTAIARIKDLDERVLSRG